MCAEENESMKIGSKKQKAKSVLENNKTKTTESIKYLNLNTIFTVLDLKSGFWQMELVQASSDLPTFMTPFGRFRWKRFPFGINSAPEMFQKKMVKIFGDIPGVEIYGCLSKKTVLITINNLDSRYSSATL